MSSNAESRSLVHSCWSILEQPNEANAARTRGKARANRVSIRSSVSGTIQDRRVPPNAVLQTPLDLRDQERRICVPPPYGGPPHGRTAPLYSRRSQRSGPHAKTLGGAADAPSDRDRRSPAVALSCHRKSAPRSRNR